MFLIRTNNFTSKFGSEIIVCEALDTDLIIKTPWIAKLYDSKGFSIISFQIINFNTQGAVKVNFS
jgi:hypothetical protein